MVFPYERISYTENDTRNIAVEFSEFIEDGMIICLNGNLGAGKTFFIKKVLEGFDIDNANSPTFAIVNEHTGKKKFYHFDFYRINSEVELLDLGIEDYFNDEDAVCLIEWADLFPKVLPANRIEISITMIDENTRKFEFKSV